MRNSWKAIMLWNVSFTWTDLGMKVMSCLLHWLAAVVWIRYVPQKACCVEDLVADGLLERDWGHESSDLISGSVCWWCHNCWHYWELMETGDGGLAERSGLWGMTWQLSLVSGCFLWISPHFCSLATMKWAPVPPTAPPQVHRTGVDCQPLQPGTKVNLFLLNRFFFFNRKLKHLLKSDYTYFGVYVDGSGG